MNAAIYSKLAFQAVNEILNKNKIPILTSGTGFYLKAFLYGMFPVVEISDETKSKIQNLKLPEKWNLLKEKDFEATKLISENDEYRISRALEISETGKLWSQIQNERVDSFLEKFTGEVIGIFLDLDRKELYKKINSRCKKMLDTGFLEEAKLIKLKYGESAPAFKSLGFNFALDYLLRKKSMEVFLEEFSQSHRNYAKKQITWFKKETLLKKLDWNSALAEIKNIEKRLLHVS